jgi:Beta propeller domain
MKSLLLVLIATLSISGLIVLAGTKKPAPPQPPVQQTRVKKTMKAFKSEPELGRYFRELAEKQRRIARRAMAANLDAYATVANEAPAPATQSEKSKSSEESVTNTQHAGVDEGGIVKVHGNHLVVLRRGRLFTIGIGDNALKPISAIDAFGPDIEPRGTWYDEMLVSGNNVVVIGYSYERGGTEVGLFDISDSGQLSYRSTYHLRSNDYYSSRNYASRLIGSKLIFYAPLYLDLENIEETIKTLPGVRKWHKGATEEEFRRIVPATRIYKPEGGFTVDYDSALHTVTVCDLANGGFDCQATSVVGPSGHVFYVSPDSVYVWASAWEDGKRNRSLLFRMPLDGSGPSALRVSGSPVDQFSFLQSDDQSLNVLVRADAKGDGMWAAEVSEGDVALMRIPLFSFSDGSEQVPRSSYRELPEPQGYTFQNRFVSDYLIYGTGSGWHEPDEKASLSNLFVTNWKRGDVHQLTLPHGVDRIEQMGADAVVVGTDGKDLHFTSMRLGYTPTIASRYTRKEASQGELRSHGFFYKPDGDNSGTLGLPISVPGRPGYQHLFKNSASILFLRNESLKFREVGELGSQPEKEIDDNCRASCVDWYGNARPLFLRGRVFALMGYEIVEGAIDAGQMKELRRVNYAPGTNYATR